MGGGVMKLETLRSIGTSVTGGHQAGSWNVCSMVDTEGSVAIEALLYTNAKLPERIVNARKQQLSPPSHYLGGPCDQSYGSGD